MGNPALLATDVGPVIDEEAFEGIAAHVDALRRTAKLIGVAGKGGEQMLSGFPAFTSPQPSPEPSRSGGGGQEDVRVVGSDRAFNFIAPIAFEVNSISDVKQEIFAPVLHVVRWSGDVDAVMKQINALGYGLTLGIQTRIDSRALRLAAQARIGNVHVNRNMVGAVVGSQPFGGEGLSGTGPKAGGPHYLYRFCAEQTVTINTAAAGGNVALLAGVNQGLNDGAH